MVEKAIVDKAEIIALDAVKEESTYACMHAIFGGEVRNIVN
jgi:hypothetical protein